MTTPSPGPASLEPLTPERRRLQTRRHLLAAAAQVFGERGFHGATLEQVAAAAGFTKGAVYSNFESKEDLFLALAEEHVNEVLERVRAMVGASEVSPSDRLEDFTELAIESFAGEQDSTALYLEFWLYALRHPEARQRLGAIERAQASAIEAIVNDQRDRHSSTGGEDSATVARLILALFHGIGVVGLFDPEAVDADFIGAAVRLVDRGLSGLHP
ncbi:MAG: TetR/AcrR family transcriptional regulator [Acidimicrobiales bacterium]